MADRVSQLETAAAALPSITASIAQIAAHDATVDNNVATLETVVAGVKTELTASKAYIDAVKDDHYAHGAPVAEVEVGIRQIFQTSESLSIFELLETFCSCD